MTLTSDTKLGPYEIVSPLGAGGMGEVYRARDTKLGRDVAIKVLPDLFASDPERLARFQREAQMLASVDLVFATSQKLLDRARRYTSRAHLFPAGVNFEAFARVRAEADGVPPDLKALPAPIAGYVGALHVYSPRAQSKGKRQLGVWASTSSLVVLEPGGAS